MIRLESEPKQDIQAFLVSIFIHLHTGKMDNVNLHYILLSLAISHISNFSILDKINTGWPKK